MINISQTHDLALIKAVVTEPKLWALTYGQDSACNPALYSPDLSYTYLHVEKDKKTVGLFQTRAQTKHVVECHIYIIPEYWGTHMSVEASYAGFQWLKNNTEYLKAFTQVPITCTHVVRLAKKIGWNLCGVIDRGVMFDNKLVDLLLYDYKL